MTRPRTAPVVDEPDLAADLAEIDDLDLDGGAHIEDTHVTSLSLTASKVERLTVSGCRLTGVELTGATLRNVTLVDVRLEDCELSGTTLDFATFQRVRFERCRMSGFVAPQLAASHTTFVECRLDQAWFRMAGLERCAFEDCDLTDADFYTATLAESRFVRSTLDGSEWSEARLDAVALHGSTVEGIRGAGALRNLVIGSDQVVPLAFPVFAALGIQVDDDYLDVHRDLPDSCAVTSNPVDAARELYELVDRNARAAPASDPVPDATVKALADADLHAVMVPREVGGTEAPIVACIDAVAEISRADASAGWCLMANAATIAFFGAWGGEDFARELFADGVPLAAGQFAPNGTATPERGGYRISGDYNFGSGVNHSDWIGAGVLTTEENSRLLMALMPRSEASFADGWDVLGLEATASWDYTVRDAWVPEGATFDFFAPVQHRGGPVYQLGVLGLTSAGHAGVAIGVVRRALDELRAIATTKARMGASAPPGEKESFLTALASLESRARSAASWVRDTFRTAEATAMRTGHADLTEVALARQSTVHATQDGAAVVRDAYLLAGTDTLRAGPLQRCFRDMHAASQHFFAGEFASLEAGKALLANDLTD